MLSQFDLKNSSNMIVRHDKEFFKAFNGQLVITDNTDSQNENFFFVHEQIFNFLKGPKKFLSHVIVVGGVKICFLLLEEATAKRGCAFGVKVNSFKSLKTQNYHLNKSGKIAFF